VSVPLNDPSSPYYDHHLRLLQQEEEEEEEEGEIVDERQRYWPPFLYAILIRLEEWFTTYFLPVMKKHSIYYKDQGEEIRFDYVLINYYANGNNYIGYHSDDERDLKSNGVIASLSLGASRDFCFKLAKSTFVCLFVCSCR
jgi:alkylated DNA repair dioxygenase AlkB